MKSDEDVNIARASGISAKTASDTKYFLGLWEAWVVQSKKENCDVIGQIENLSRERLQHWLSRFILEVKCNNFLSIIFIY